MKSSNPHSGCRKVELAKTIDTTYPCPSKNQGGIGIMQSMAVRRLTPVECERLQGFPDNYTNIKENCPDGPRYKAMGNSMAVPVMRWIGERINMVNNEQ
jgi:DNA (cytosine-5)-methyltransferase 1